MQETPTREQGKGLNLMNIHGFLDRLHEPALSAAEAKAYLSASIRPLQAMTLEASYHVQHMKQRVCLRGD